MWLASKTNCFWRFRLFAHIPCQTAVTFEGEKVRYKLLRPGDAVITFNWDLLLEEALYDLNKESEYKLTDGAISILKPHGSLDWFDSKEVSIDRKLIFPLNEKFKRIQVFKRFRAPRISRPTVPVILPPVVNKKIVYDELQAIWRDAWLALRHASEIYAIGYSLPPEDLHARLTIRSAIRGNEKFERHRPKVAVVNPDRGVYLRFPPDEWHSQIFRDWTSRCFVKEDGGRRLSSRSQLAARVGGTRGGRSAFNFRRLSEYPTRNRAKGWDIEVGISIQAFRSHPASMRSDAANTNSKVSVKKFTTLTFSP